jgi:ribonuclease-3
VSGVGGPGGPPPGGGVAGAAPPPQAQQSPRYAELHTFADPALLEEALTHPTYANEHAGAATYQRLEFLGDAVLQLIASELLLARHPDWDEGRLTKARQHLVDRRQCTGLAERLGLPAALRTERGLSGAVGANSKVLGDVFEAFVAAIYVDGGLARAREAIAPLLAPLAETLAPEALRDAKSALQEYCQARRMPLPEYLDDGWTGPDHKRLYRVRVRVADAEHGPGVGSKKQLAQAEAARIALEALAGSEAAMWIPPESSAR